MDDVSDLLIFKMREPQKEKVETQAPVPSPPANVIGILEPGRPKEARKQTDNPADPGSIYFKQGGDYPDPMHFYRESAIQGKDSSASQAEAATMPAAGSKADSREKAKGLYCAAHPFRHAYAICAYCHRPFCYEDTVEYQNDYYCIEDVDKISTHYTEALTNEYSAASILTTFVLIGSFLLYFYFSYPQLIYIFEYMIFNPINFLGNFSISYGVTILTLAAMVASIAGAIYILVGSRRGHMIATVVSMLAVMLFVYQYIGSGTIYLAVLAGFEFAGFLAAVNSSASEAMAYNQVYERGPEYGLAYGYGAKY